MSDSGHHSWAPQSPISPSQNPNSNGDNNPPDSNSDGGNGDNNPPNSNNDDDNDLMDTRSDGSNDLMDISSDGDNVLIKDPNDIFADDPNEEDDNPDNPPVCVTGSEEDVDTICIGVLHRNGLPAHEPEGLEIPDERDSEFGDEQQVDWDAVISQFTVHPNYDPQRGGYENGVIGYNFADIFAASCRTNGHDLRTISDNHMDVAYNRIMQCLAHWPNQTHVDQVCTSFSFRLSSHREELHKLETKSLERAVDPNYVQVIGLADRYRAWTAVQDYRLSGIGFDSMTVDRYDIPPEREGQIPMHEYQWFAAEVVSPVLAAESETTAKTIENACRVLRSNFRIHKPMEYSTGLHVHLGHRHGWNLLQLKKFVTLWLLIERVLIRIHRKDRESDHLGFLMANFGEDTKLAQALWHPLPHVRQKVASCLPRESPWTRARNEAETQRHVPSAHLTDRQREFLRHVWCYTSIDGLAEAMEGGYNEERGVYMRAAVRLRVSGHKKTDTPNSRDDAEGRNSQTLEVRTMHGTLDADHINYWISILRRILYFVRRASTEEFSVMIPIICLAVTQPDHLHLKQLLQILQVPNVTRRYFFLPHNRDRDPNTGEEWFMYPDKDRVDWNQPFMVDTHGSTHGVEYDDLVNDPNYFPG
ncbi:hypothetical protein M434DRAFT_30134 [Hypoxylon sp. CO27-5]|nr:hypothetical protein M434DRAFT_30134 [Hypoxylon sp. CO27-5]